MKLHIFIDGSWLFRACAKVLAGKTENPAQPFNLDFAKLNYALLSHVEKLKPKCNSIGDCYFSTSIFELTDDFDQWPSLYPNITPAMIEKTKNGVFSRTVFAKNAIDDGYQDAAIYHPRIKEYMVRKLKEGNYQEKQVDTSVVALLVRYAITQPEDYHAVLTGDADILPAIRVAYPEYTRNVVIVTSHPDELKAEYRQSSFSLNNFSFDIPPFFLQEHALEIIRGENVYRCTECGKVFVRHLPIPVKAQPFCKNCFKKRE